MANETQKQRQFFCSLHKKDSHDVSDDLLSSYLFVYLRHCVNPLVSPNSLHTVHWSGPYTEFFVHFLTVLAGARCKFNLLMLLVFVMCKANNY